MKNKKNTQNDASRTHARGMTYAYGDINITGFSDHAHARARKLRPFSDAEITIWRERIFANGMEDPVKVAVGEAIKDFGKKKDFTLWAWYANRIGVNNFIELYFEQKSIIRTSYLRNPAAAFHMRIKRFYAAMTGKEVAQ